MSKAVVLLSGGQDSTTCLILALDKYGRDNVYPICFDYSQSHKVEINQAIEICSALDVRLPVILSANALHELGGAALTDSNVRVDSDATATGNVYAEAHNLPSTVVPGRNLLFLTLAAAYGAKLGIYELWTGGCLADREGYPDCRWEFYEAAQAAIALALDEESVSIITPLIDVTKGQTFALAAALGKLDVIVNLTHTCYRGERKMHDWGAGCGNCPACSTRQDGWNEYLALPVQ